MQECLFCTSEKDLVIVRSKKHKSEGLPVCMECHRALWIQYSGNEELIYIECGNFRIERQLYKDLLSGKSESIEIKDKARSNKFPITYEEIADLSWELHYNKTSKIYDYLKTKK